ncbi:[FeFe] hydrogenase H-cluster maturation GTPase HydF [Clostridium oryzae]|uniref:tRNA modification GTPase MnmE n=1 Tax=Clostridium oryzae TaxID=1450648 RepID=A0A1V4IPD7_9CLOT|nr:[FeFe] hydrogenase H-cluster maturation GTPase HydF [Clostridium oryzae]OPJ61317.1 tRNA modification GTPase MnmE [Clostridium oryzae]
MSLNNSPRGVSLHIALFGKRNAGKSSLINAITGGNTAIVSEVKGTTTDPVYKSMEILPLGPCVLIDTAGIDDDGTLGELRIEKTKEILKKTDLALLVIDSKLGISAEDNKFIKIFKEKQIPAVVVFNKIDSVKIEEETLKKLEKDIEVPVVGVSSAEKININKLKDTMIKIMPEDSEKFRIVGDLISPGDFVVLVTPIDKAAPKGRLILPQQQTIRDILESDAIAIVTKEYELRETLEKLGRKPRLVITDSQAFLKVAADTPKDVPLTSFSILFARNKGDLNELIKGAKAVDRLKNGDKVLIAEGCTHHRQSDDIGTVKIPRWIRQRTGKDIEFEFASGASFTEEVKKYSLIVHCGACMLNKTAMMSRIEAAAKFGVPIVNYGVLIAYVQGIMPRALEPFPLAKLLWEEENI